MKQVFITRWLSLFGATTAFLCMAVDSTHSSGTNKVDLLWKAVMEAETSDALSRTFNQCRFLSWDVQKEVLVRCIRQLNSPDHALACRTSQDDGGLAMEQLNVVGQIVNNDVHPLGRYDLSTQKGRSLWMASLLLHVELPSLQESTKQDNTATIIVKILEAWNAVDVKLYEQELAKLQYCLRLPKDERLSLARSQETDRRVLDVLANDTDVEVRRLVAANYKTPDKTVVKMWNSDSDATVRGSAQSNAILVKSFRLNTKPGYIPPEPKKEK